MSSAFLTAVVFLLQPAQAPGTPAPVALVGASVLSMIDQRIAPDQTVLIRDGRIEAVGPRNRVAVPAGVRRIDARGKFLMPGLVDTHVHLEGRPDEWMAIFLAYGVTTVFNLKGAPEHLALRARVRRGEQTGPDIYTSGPYTNEPVIKTPEDARRAVEEQKRAGYDMVKIHGNMTAETHAALTAAGREFGIPIMGHAPRNLPFSSVIDVRQSMVAHGEELIYTQYQSGDTAGLGATAARMAEANVWLTPNLAMFHGIATQWGRANGADSSLALPDAAYLNAPLMQIWTKGNPYTGRNPAGAANIASRYRFLVTLTKVFADAGVKMLAGTDTPLPLMFPGYSLHDEIEELSAAGLGPWRALATATRNPAEWIAAQIDSSYRAGTITPGARADLLVLARNPLVELSTARRPVGVVAAGRWFDEAALERLRNDLAEANRAARTPGGGR